MVTDLNHIWSVMKYTDHGGNPGQVHELNIYFKIINNQIEMSNLTPLQTTELLKLLLENTDYLQKMKEGDFFYHILEDVRKYCIEQSNEYQEQKIKAKGTASNYQFYKGNEFAFAKVVQMIDELIKAGCDI